MTVDSIRGYAMIALVRKLIDRRIPRYTAVYLGFSIGLIYFTDFIADEFLLSPYWTRIVIVAVLVLSPSYLLIVYNHGRPGPDKWRAAEWISIPINLVVAGLALYLLFGEQDLSAAVTTVTVTNEEGESVERVIAKQEFRKRTAIFEFDPIELPAEDEWLPYFFSEGIKLDMSADDFFDPVSSSSFAEQLRASGHDDLLNVPFALKREIAEAVHAQWLLSGSLSKSGSDYTVTTRLYQTSDAHLVAETVYTGPDIYELIDQISIDLRADLEIPRRDEIEDLPVASYVTADREALMAFGRGVRASAQRDWNASVNYLEEATQRDRAFALAQFYYANMLGAVNRFEEAKVPITLALENVYRIPERWQFLVKSEFYFLHEDLDRAIAVVEMWAELYPDDILALQHLTRVQLGRDQRTEAISTFERIYELNSGEAAVLKNVAQLHSSLGQFDEAQEALREYLSLYPEDVTGYVGLAGVQQLLGDHDGVRASYERALLLEPTNSSVIVNLAFLEHRLGNKDAALEGLLAALEASNTPMQKANAWQRLEGYYRVWGQSAAAVDAIEGRRREQAQFQAPVAQLIRRAWDVDLYFELGREREAERVIETLRNELSPQYDHFLFYAELLRAIGEQDREGAEQLLSQVEASIDEIQVANQRVNLNTLRGRVAELQQDWSAALSAYREILNASPANYPLNVDVARSLRNLGRFEEALDAVAQMQRLAPGAPKSFLEQSYALEGLGDRDGARAAATRAVELWDDADLGFKPAQEARELLRRLSE